MLTDGPTLEALAAMVEGRVIGDPDRRVTDVTHDSRQCSAATLFVAVRGHTSDGHTFAARAADAGAALCVDHEMEGVAADQLIVADTRRSMGPLASAVHGDPWMQLEMVGVTGTNGKTMVTHLLESIAGAAGRRAAVVGTLGARIGGRAVPIARTTPEATDLQRLLAGMVSAGVELAAIEVSSHGLALRRVDGMRFDVAAFTNLSQDHLDFHGDLETYFAAKASMFEEERAARAVVWIDDPWGERLAATTALPVTTVGLTAADVGARDVELRLDGSRFTLDAPAGRAPIDFSLGGDFNVANALVAAACALELGISLEEVVSGLEALDRVPGRFDRVDVGQPFDVIVDYAHTPDGIAAVLGAVRRMGPRQVVAVVGAGGDRDPDKRPRMGAAAAGADLVVVTSDNPRSEDPLDIISAVAAGARAAGAEVLEDPDRRTAIRAAVHRARPGDVVLILGKGHEEGQEFADHVEPFSDRTVAQEEVLAL